MSPNPLEYYAPSRPAPPFDISLFGSFTLLLVVGSFPACFIVILFAPDPDNGPIQNIDVLVYCALIAFVLLCWIAWTATLLYLVARHHLSRAWLFALLFLIIPSIFTIIALFVLGEALEEAATARYY